MLGYQKAQRELGKEGNESIRKCRKRLFQAARELTLALVCSFERLSDSQRKEVEEAMDWWEEQQAAIVRDPSHIPASLAPAALLPDHAAQYLASITDTLSEFYVCRKYDSYDVCLVASARSLGTSFFSIRRCGQREAAVSIAVASCFVRSVASEDNMACGYFSTADNWVYTDKTLQAGHFKCPMCQTFYRPWASSPSTISPNEVLVFVESKTASSQKMPGGLKDLLGRVTNKQGMVQFYPCIWPDTASTALANKMKEIIAQVRTEVDEGMSPSQMIQKCMDIASESAQSAPCFSQHTQNLNGGLIFFQQY